MRPSENNQGDEMCKNTSEGFHVFAVQIKYNIVRTMDQSWF